MEDSLICFDEVNKRFGLNQDKDPVCVWGVFDGHGGTSLKRVEIPHFSLRISLGKQVALHLEARFIRIFAEEFNGDGSNEFESVIRQTYKRMDKEILEVSTEKGWVCGSTGSSSKFCPL